MAKKVKILKKKKANKIQIGNENKLVYKD